MGKEGLIIPPHTAVLASSREVINMPVGYMGLLQTKGSLARMMVSLHFSDGQVDCGFRGKITFEVFNASSFTITIPAKAAVGNLYILKANTLDCQPYSGKYGNADGPTIQIED